MTTLRIMGLGLRREAARAFKTAAAAAAFVALVAGSNWLTDRFGMVAGLVTAGTFTAAAVLAVRDIVREQGGRLAALGCVAVGAALSWLLADPFIAVASAVAFGVSEIVDAAVYEPLRESGRLRAAAVSNVVGAVVDSVLFLWIAGFVVWPAAATQTVTKWVVCVVPLVIVGGARALLRNRVRPEGA